MQNQTWIQTLEIILLNNYGWNENYIKLSLDSRSRYTHPYILMTANELLYKIS